MQQIYLFDSMVTGYARKTMNNTDITHHPQRDIIEHRIKVLNFFARYGTSATFEAFSISRSTIYSWKQTLKANNGRLASLAPASRAPNMRRKRLTDPRISNLIIAERTVHHRLGKDKLVDTITAHCKTWGIPPPSTSTVGRIIADLKDQGKLPTYNKVTLSAATGRIIARKPNSSKTRLKKSRRGSYSPKAPGDLVQIDTVVKFILGIKRYCITAIDVKGRFSFAYTYKSQSSANARDFLDKLQVVAPFEIKRVQTDNGHEFYKYFHEACETKKLTHFWNYPRSPKMNAYIERFNRTIQEEYIDYNLHLMADDIDQFNKEMMDWLIWYNTKRPHYSLGQTSPMCYLIKNFGLSRMLWTHTQN